MIQLLFRKWPFIRSIPYAVYAQIRCRGPLRTYTIRIIQSVVVIAVAYVTFGYLHDCYGRIGTASYYGLADHDNKTASGRRFNMYRMTAAHRKLPIGTTVRVTNLENGRSATVTVIDRGPYVRGRIIDVSWEVARQLGMLRKGTATVKIDILSRPK